MLKNARYQLRVRTHRLQLRVRMVIIVQGSPMARYRKKPVVIEAEQWLPVGNTGTMPVPSAPPEVLRRAGEGWQIRTIEGWLELTPGDWIIRGVEGEYYPCKPSVFEATYEPTDE